MAEYLANAVQDVALNEPILMDASIPCNRGYVIHEDGTGVFILRGIVNNPTCRRARYKLEFNGNIAIPTGGTVGPIAVAITLNGETRPTSRAIFTPAAVDTYGNVTSVAHIDVPAGCCFSVSVRYVNGNTDPTAVPTPSIQVINANLVIDRTA
jgi:hypothetical protein